MCTLDFEAVQTKGRTKVVRLYMYTLIPIRYSCSPVHTVGVFDVYYLEDFLLFLERGTG